MKKLLSIGSFALALFIFSCTPEDMEDFLGNKGKNDSIPGLNGDSIPNFPGIDGDSIPNFPGIDGDSIPNFPGIDGDSIPGFPGIDGDSIPNFPGFDGDSIPGFPGFDNDSIPGFGGDSIPNFPGFDNDSIPGFPGFDNDSIPGIGGDNDDDNIGGGDNNDDDNIGGGDNNDDDNIGGDNNDDDNIGGGDNNDDDNIGGGDNNDDDNIGGGDNNDDDNIGGVEDNQIYKDKEDFQNIAVELRNEFKASDFESIMELAEYIAKEYSEYNFDKAENWFGSCLEELWNEIESNERYDIYEIVYKLSAFKGKWTANEYTQSWERTNANNLSLHVTDQNGNPCEITLTTSGRTKRVHCFDSQEKIYNGYYDYENGVWVENITYGDIEKIYVEVPEKISVVLKQNGYRLAEIIINTDLSSMSGVDYNLATDKYDVNASIYFNGYSLNLENAYYENKKESKVIASFKHGNKTLLSASLTATPEILVSNFDEEWDENDFNSKNNVLSIKILNKLELIGTCNNLKSLADVLNDDYNEDTDSKVNRYLKINAYFYGAKEPTATIKFESEEDGYYDYWEGKYIYDYDLIPVIEFQDYSRHSLEDFFNEEDFEKTINAFESLFNQFEDLLRGYDFDF